MKRPRKDWSLPRGKDIVEDGCEEKVILCRAAVHNPFTTAALMLCPRLLLTFGDPRAPTCR